MTDCLNILSNFGKVSKLSRRQFEKTIVPFLLLLLTTFLNQKTFHCWSRQQLVATTKNKSGDTKIYDTRYRVLLFWVSLMLSVAFKTSPLCWMPLWWVSLCWMSWHLETYHSACLNDIEFDLIIYFILPFMFHGYTLALLRPFHYGEVVLN